MIKEERKRGTNKDETAADPKKGGAKGAPPPKGKDPKAAAVVEEDEAPKRVLPECKNHVNEQIRDFLYHFESDRRINYECSKLVARKRDDEEKQQIANDKEKEKED